MGSPMSIVDPPAPPVAVLVRDGTIVWVNEAWQRFDWVNGVPSENQSVSDNSLAITPQADDDRASYIASEVGDVLHDDRSPFTAVYPCRTRGRNRWFQVYASGVTVAGERHGLVLHRRIPRRTDSDGSATETNDWAATDPPERTSNRLVTYTIGPNETATDALLVAFEAIGVDPKRQETTLHDTLATDAVDRLLRKGEEFRLTVHVWEHTVCITPDTLSIYQTE